MGASTDDSGTDIFNRVVLGATINKATEQVLDVIFRLTIFPPKDDVVGVSTVSGVDYDTTMRMLDADSRIGADTFDKIGLKGLPWTAYDGDLGLIDAAAPQGGSSDGGSMTVTATTYVPGDKFMEFTAEVGLTGWVLSNDLIRTIRMLSEHFTFQCQYDSQVSPGDGIPKDATEIIDLSWRISWDRQP
jgi:hypothetical protein